MPTLAENAAERLVIKAHNDGLYDPTAEPDLSSDPGASDGQIWRFVDHNLSLTREAFSPVEMREDRQQPIDKLGTKRVEATINTLLSCSSHKAVIAAVLRGAWSVSAIALDESDMTSVAADNSTAKFTFGGGDPVSEGLRVGQIVRFTGLSEAGNNSKNFLILGFGGASNREMTVYPAPETMTADSEFDVTTVGRSVFPPTSAPTKSKFAIETYNSDSDLAKVFTEITFGGLTLTAEPNAHVQMSFTGMGRNRRTYTGGDAPFFTAPTAAPATEVISSMDGLLRLGNTTVGFLTALELSFATELAAPAQINRDGLAAGIVRQGMAVISGSFTLFELDGTYHNIYDEQTEFAIMAYMPASRAADAPAMVVFLPRVKITNQEQTIVDGAKALQCTFSAARYFGTAPGVESTSLFVHDTQIS